MRVIARMAFVPLLLLAVACGAGAEDRTRLTFGFRPDALDRGVLQCFQTEWTLKAQRSEPDGTTRFDYVLNRPGKPTQEFYRCYTMIAVDGYTYDQYARSS